MSDDYIKRDDAIKALGKRPLNWMDTPEEIQEGMDWDEHVKAIEAIPSADVVKRERGRWILSEDQDEIEVANGNFRFKCSNCGASDIHSKRTIVRYCWDCGADMR